MSPKIKDNTKADGRDLFQTPHYATRLLLPFLKPYDLIWEPACGGGRMVEVLELEHPVWPTDVLYDPDDQDCAAAEKWDFLSQTKDEIWMRENVNVIVTNPPFGKKREFYRKCLYYWKQCGTPFALLIPADYSQWIIKAVYEEQCQKIIPTRRIDYITPTGLHGGNGHTSRFHSMWLVKGFNIQIPKPVLPSEIYVPLSLRAKKEDIL